MTVGEILKTNGNCNLVLESKNYFSQENLFEAIKSRDLTKIRCLINNGININTKDKDGWTALMHATDNGDNTIVRLLIELGADLDIQNDDGQTALINATFINAIVIAKILIKKGANVNVKDNEGQTALMMAALSNAKEIGELLVLEGADVFAVDKLGMDAFAIASKTWAFKHSDYFLKSRQNQIQIDIKRMLYIFNDHFSMEKMDEEIDIHLLNNVFIKKYGYELNHHTLEAFCKEINKKYSDRELRIIDKKTLKVCLPENKTSVWPKISDENIKIFTSTPAKFWDGFEEYLISCGYKERTPSGLPSTAPQYRFAVADIKYKERKSSLHAFCSDIDSIIVDYDYGGIKEALGQTGHRTWINALKRFREYLFFLQENHNV